MMKYFLLLLIAVVILPACIARTTQPSARPIRQVVAPKLLPDQAKVPILIYHHVREVKSTDSLNDQTFIVAPENFKQQMEYLGDNGFTPISFGNLVDYFSGDFLLPEKPIIISLDDGVINHYENAWPILKDNNLTATFFIFPNPIGKSPNYMNWEQLQELVGANMEIGSHGWYHLYLDKISPTELNKELVESKAVLEQRLGIKVRSLAYPFGEYNDTIKQAVKVAGYETARDIINGAEHTPASLYNLKGYFITNDFSRFISIVK